MLVQTWLTAEDNGYVAEVQRSTTEGEGSAFKSNPSVVIGPFQNMTHRQLLSWTNYNSITTLLQGRKFLIITITGNTSDPNTFTPVCGCVVL